MLILSRYSFRPGHVAALCCLGLAIGCRRPPPPPPPPSEPEAVPDALSHLKWHATSRDANAVVEQSAKNVGECTLSCARDGVEVWTQSRCAASDNDFRFVSDDCQQFVILFEYPESKGARAAAIVGLAFPQGKAPVPLRLDRFLLATAQLRVTKQHFSWLAGALGVPGTRPHHRADGTGIEFETVDHRPHSLSFAQFLQPAPAAAGEPAEKPRAEDPPERPAAASNAGAPAWRSRFSKARGEVERAERQYSEALSSVDGAGGKEQAKKTLAADNQRVRAQQALIELERQASNAGIPADWRQ